MAYDFNEYPIFRGLNSTQVENFTSGCQDEVHEAGTVLIQERTAGDRVYFIYEGKVTIQITGADGNHRELARIASPAVLGEMEFLTGSPRSATVTATEEVRALTIGFDALRTRVTDGDPASLKVFYNIASVLAHRLANMDTRLSEMHETEPQNTADLDAFHRKIFEDWNV